MKICYMIDKNYLELTKTSMKYINTFYRGDDPIEFCIFHFGDLSDIEPYENVSFIKIDKMNYPFFIHRSFMFDRLDEKVIFMDSDTICFTNIEKLFNVDLENNMIGAAQHSILKTHEIAYKIYKPNDQLSKIVKLDDFPFFNAGVMLVDCAKWKSLNCTASVLETFELYRGQKYDWNDEVVLNCLFGRELTKFIDERWNYNVSGVIKPFIRHYYGHPK